MSATHGAPESPNPKAKRQILVVHGALGAALQMEPVAKALEPLGDVTNVELPGHGATPLPDGETFDMQTFVRTLAVAAKRAGERPVVFGYSMGGYAALVLETQQPGTFSNIITLGTKFAWTPALALRECSRLDPSVISEKIPKFASTLETRHAGAGGWKQVLEQTADLLATLGDHPMLARDTLGAVEAPVCVAVGERDDTVSASEAREYASYIERSTFEVLPEAPHPIERVSTQAVFDLVRNAIHIAD